MSETPKAMEEFDRRVLLRIAQEAEKGKPFDEILFDVKEATRAEWLDLVKNTGLKREKTP